MPKDYINNNDDEAVDAVLRTGENDIQEELDILSGYNEYLRDQFRERSEY